jgi:hypothetical protein
MKFSSVILAIVVLLVGRRSGFSQGFVNLDFSSANVPGSTPSGSLVSITNAIPGWVGNIGGIPQTTVLYNDLYLGTATLAILSSNVGGIPGNAYTVVLQAGNYGGPTNSPASIAQTALIPTNAESILFTASLPYAAGWQVTINNQVIPVSQVGTVGSFYGLYAGDVSDFAGQVQQLEFTALSGSGSTVNLDLDSISFSSIPVPEPSELTLTALGALVLGLRRWRNCPR